MGFKSAQISQLNSKTGFLPKSDSKKHTSSTVRLQGLTRAAKEQNQGQWGVQNTKSHYEAKHDFKMRPEFIVE